MRVEGLIRCPRFVAKEQLLCVRVAANAQRQNRAAHSSAVLLWTKGASAADDILRHFLSRALPCTSSSSVALAL